MDSCDLKAKGVKRTYVQFKTTLMLPEPPKYFQRYACKFFSEFEHLDKYLMQTEVDPASPVCGWEISLYQFSRTPPPHEVEKELILGVAKGVYSEIACSKCNAKTHDHLIISYH